MNVCQEHWDMMRAEIERLGLSHLVARDAEVASKRMKNQFVEKEGKATPANFDPLMDMFYNVGSNCMSFIESAGGSPLYSMVEGPEDVVDRKEFPRADEGATWPKCVICYLNLAHKLICKDGDCTLDKERGYDWVIGRAGKDAYDTAVNLGLLSAKGV
jgi:hypothetical protein